jgi:hypothetical protein
MKAHTKLYLSEMGYDESDWIGCEVWGCSEKANDLHHLDCKGMGGSKTKDFIENIMALCRTHHIKMGDNKRLINYLKACHRSKLIERGVKFNPNLILIEDES